MERQVSTATILVIVLVALAAVIGIGFAAFKIAKSSGNDGVQEMATQTDYASKSKFSEFNDKEVTGLMLKNFMDNNKGSHITFVIQTRTFRNPAKITSNRRVIMHNQGVYAVYGKQFDAPDSTAYLSVVSGEEIPKWTGEAYLLERRDAASLRYNGVYKVQDDFDYTAVHSNGTPEYIDDSAAFLCNLIYDNGDNIVGIIAKQKNKPGATTKESSVFAADSVLEHINKTDGGNIPLGGLVVWGESGGKQTLIREDGKAGQGFGEVGLQKDKVDTSMYDSIADNAVEEFKFEDLERKILIGYCGSSSQIKIPDTVTHVKSLTSDGENPNAYKDNLRNVSAIVFNAGCVKIENLDLSICPNLYSVYVSPTTTVIGGKKLNMVQIEAPRHLKAQIQACREGSVFVNDWDKKLYNCGCPSCQIADNDWVYVWDGLDIVGYVGTLPKTLEIPLGCTGLGPRALAGGQFETITLPNSLKYVGQEAFMECQNAKSIDMSACTIITEIPDKTFYNCDGIGSVKLPTSVIKIGGSAFYDCDALTSVSGCDNVVSIGERTFYQCNVLASVSQLTNLEVIGAYAFSITKAMPNEFPQKVYSVGASAFAQCYGGSSTELTIPGSIEIIPNNCFNYTGRKIVRISEGVKELSAGCFSSCSSLTDVYIPVSVTKISPSAFNASANVTLHFAEGSPFLADGGAVYNEDYTVLIKGPQTLTASDTFTIRDTCVEIASSAFSGCTLGTLVIPDSVTKMGSSVFSNCKGLTTVTLPKSLKTVGSGILRGSSITTLNIPKEMKLSTWTTNSTFLGGIDGGWQHELRTINTNDNPYIQVKDGAVYLIHPTNGTKALACVLRGPTSLTLDNDCTVICARSLERSDVVTLDTGGVTSISGLGFYTAQKLKNVTLPKVKTLGSRIFEGTVVVNVYLPELTTTSGGDLTNGGSFDFVGGVVKIGSKISNIAAGSFAKHLNIDTKTTGIDLSECVLVKTLVNNTIRGQSKLTFINLPPNLDVIKEGAFRDISTEFTMEIPESVTTIEAGSFVNCPKLKLKAPSHLKSQNSSDRWGIPNSRITWY